MKVSALTDFKYNNTLKKIPDILIYNCPNKNVYRMADTKTGNYVGRISVIPRHHTLYIDELLIYKNFREMGYGTKFLNFAKALSKQYGSGGNLKVLAAPLKDSDYAPHIFYRKYGFECKNKDELDILDRCIYNGERLNPDHPEFYMDYIA